MDFLLDALTNWLKEMLVGGIMGNLSGMFDSVNQQVADIATQVGQTPQGWNGSIFSMIQNLSNSIMVPIAGVILAIVMTLELIQMITDRNNLHDVDTWMIFKWVFKSAAAILIVTNTWNIVMGVFDMPLRYNYDKPEKPRRIKGFEVFSLVFSSFSKPKNHTEISRIIGGVSLTTNE